MHKVWIVIKREYLTRVKNKAFIISTILAPLLFALLMGLVVYTSISSLKENEKFDVYVIDPSGQVFQRLASDENIKFVKADAGLEEMKEKVKDKTSEGVLFLPADLDKETTAATFYTKKSISMTTQTALRNKVREALVSVRMLKAGIDESKLAQTKVQFSLNLTKLQAGGEKAGNATLGAIMGYIMAFIIYIMVAIYGQFVMQGVMEEKTSRIVEVVISSVRPIQLMFGKIMGIGAVGVTQIMIWFALGTLAMMGVGFVAAQYGISTSAPPPAAEAMSPQQQEMMLNILKATEAFDASLLLFFAFYFFGGFLIFSTLFAAIGSAVDQPQDAQQIAWIPMIPMVTPMLFLSVIMANPNGSLAFWFSLVPFFSPTVMMIRLAGGEVAAWELVLSMLLLLGGIALMTWLSARIYRVGILLYGQKPTAATLAKWIFAKV